MIGTYAAIQSAKPRSGVEAALLRGSGRYEEEWILPAALLLARHLV